MGDAHAELRASMQLVEAVEREVQDERQNEMGSSQDGLSVDSGSDSSRRMEDVEFRLKKDGWMLISPFSQGAAGFTCPWTREVDDAVMARSR